MYCDTKWNNTKSSSCFDVPSGTKQGGILSPDFFSLYIDDLIKLLRSSGMGCHVNGIAIASIFFADDMTILSPSRHGLQKLIDLSANFCRQHCLDFNVKKSKIMVFGKEMKNLSFAPVHLNDSVIDYVDEFKYLGVTLVSGKALSFSVKSDLRSFYRATNSIFSNSICSNEQILMRLLYANCVPILSYACAVKEYNCRDMSSCNTAINHEIRKIFSYARSESIRHLRQLFNYGSIYEIFANARNKFLKAAKSSSNSVIAHLANCFKVA